MIKYPDTCPDCGAKLIKQTLDIRTNTPSQTAEYECGRYESVTTVYCKGSDRWKGLLQTLITLTDISDLTSSAKHEVREGLKALFKAKPKPNPLTFGALNIGQVFLYESHEHTKVGKSLAQRVTGTILLFGPDEEVTLPDYRPKTETKTEAQAKPAPAPESLTFDELNLGDCFTIDTSGGVWVKCSYTSAQRGMALKHFNPNQKVSKT